MQMRRINWERRQAGGRDKPQDQIINHIHQKVAGVTTQCAVL